MRLITITRLFAISMVLLSGTPAFAAREIHHDTRDFCGAQNAAFCRRSPFNFEISGASAEIPGASGDSQAAANAASKTWPGDMILN
jgi:hypothetical protein